MPEAKQTVTIRELRKNLKAIVDGKKAAIVGRDYYGTIHDARAIIIPAKISRWEGDKGSNRKAIAEARRQAARAFKTLAGIKAN